MNDLTKGDRVFIQSFKHDGSVHRTWSKGIVIDNNDDFCVVVTDHCFVVESDNRRWITKEPAICFFYEKRWFNIISMIRKNGIYYYCNIASPSIYDGEAIKNIDYDLDLKVYPDGSYNILDEYEYQQHAKQMNYPKEIKNIVENELKSLINQAENKVAPFDFQTIDYYLMEYFKMLSV
ncbi:MAG: DUF402 domain-containing protein [Erysipelotrichaceae bacterium]|nr:DUF402 domain-containing protein [Erysipelotrichaceae bacterium]